MQARHPTQIAAQRLTDLIPPEQWAVYAQFITELTRRGLPYAIGGGLAVSAYAACARNTKDMDLFILEEHSRQITDITRELGFEEYTEVPYDPTWSYRSAREGYIIDFLWKMLNGKARVSESWVSLGWDVSVRDVTVKLLPVEELIMCKLYILRSDRADWPDILSLLYARGIDLDWDRLLSILGEDRLALGGVMSVLRWLCPGLASRLPDSIWAPMGLLPPQQCAPEIDHDRVTLLHAEHLFGDTP